MASHMLESHMLPYAVPFKKGRKKRTAAGKRRLRLASHMLPFRMAGKGAARLASTDCGWQVTCCPPRWEAKAHRGWQATCCPPRWGGKSAPRLASRNAARRMLRSHMLSSSTTTLCALPMPELCGVGVSPERSGDIHVLSEPCCGSGALPLRLLLLRGLRAFDVLSEPCCGSGALLLRPLLLRGLRASSARASASARDNCSGEVCCREEH